MNLLEILVWSNINVKKMKHLVESFKIYNEIKSKQFGDLFVLLVLIFEITRNRLRLNISYASKINFRKYIRTRIFKAFRWVLFEIYLKNYLRKCIFFSFSFLHRLTNGSSIEAIFKFWEKIVIPGHIIFNEKFSVFHFISVQWFF